MAPNEKAIRAWMKVNRPDLTPAQIDGVFANEAMFFVMAMAFEAGRVFQRHNPAVTSFILPGVDYVFEA